MKYFYHILLILILINQCATLPVELFILTTKGADFIMKYSDLEKIRKYYLEDANYTYLQNKYKWFTDEIYLYARYYCLVDIKVIFSFIDIENQGDPTKNNVYYFSSKPQPIGIMRVMSFHSENPSSLTNIQENLKIGCKLMNDCYLTRKKDILQTLSCYKYGKNSKKIDFQYGQKILSNL